MLEAIPVTAVGGLLISFGCFLNLLFCGRLTGTTSALHAMSHLDQRSSKFRWKTSFVLGIALSAIASYHFHGQSGKVLGHRVTFFETQLNTPATYLIIGGIFSGLGARLCHGCITEHGICGVALLIKKSFVALLVILLTAIFTSHYFHNNGYPVTPVDALTKSLTLPVLDNYSLVGISLLGLAGLIILSSPKKIPENASSLLAGFIFGLGCQVGGFCRVSTMKAFVVTFGQERWDATVGQVMGVAIAANFVLFSFVLGRRRPIFNQVFEVPSKSEKVTNSAVVGAALFGIGWGMTSMTPGMGIILSVVTKNGFVYLLSVICGMFLHTIFNQDKVKIS